MKYRYLDWKIDSSPQNPGDNAIGILTLNRPEHANAIVPRMTMELHQMVDEIKGGFKWSSQHRLCLPMEATGQAPLRAFSSRASFGALR